MTDAPTDAPGGQTASLGEFGRIAEYFRPLATGFPGARNLTDDTARIDVPEGRALAVTTDTLVAGVHFLASDGPADIAAKALRVNLSDLAAAGAEPLCYSLGLALPEDKDDSWVKAFADSLKAEQEHFGLHLCGGDSVATPGPVTITVTAMGLLSAAGAPGRGGARAGDDVWVSGTIGDGLLGLEVARGLLAGPHAEALAARYRRPAPRLALGWALAGSVSAMLDVSDGLVADLGHIAEASGVTVQIEARAVPLSDGAGEALAEMPDRFPDLLTGGDDYELAFTAPAAARGAVEDAARRSETPVRRIGTVREGAPSVRVLDADGAAIAFTRPGYRHG